MGAIMGALLLARGRDRLETPLSIHLLGVLPFSYSLGDAIDWKLRYSIQQEYNDLSPTR